MGASSRSPSPMTTVPHSGSSFSAMRIASTAAASAASLSPRPIHFDAAIAAASVTRTISRTRTRSRTLLAAKSARFIGMETPWLTASADRQGSSACRARAALFGFLDAVLKQLGADPHRLRADAGFYEEHREAEADRDHRADEQPGDGRGDVEAGQAGAEQQHDDRAYQHSREHR